MIFRVMTQLLCMDCCWFTPVWARMYLKLHRAFYRQGLPNNPPVLLPCMYSFTVSICCALHQAWSTCAYLPYRLCFCPLSQSFVVIKFNLLVWSRRIDGVCLKLPIYDPLLVGKNPPSFEAAPGKALSPTQMDLLLLHSLQECTVKLLLTQVIFQNCWAIPDVVWEAP